MTERDDLLASIAGTIKDYRAGEIPERTPAHIARWIDQFSDDVRFLCCGNWIMCSNEPIFREIGP